MELTINEVPVPDPSAPPTTELEELAELERRDLVAFFGDDDLADDAPALARQYGTQEDYTKWWLVARDVDGHLVGGIFADLPLRDNTSRVDVSLVVDPDIAPAMVAAVATPLWEALVSRLTPAGRSIVQAWQMHRDALPTADDRLVPATEVGAIVPDHWSAILTELGFTLEQVERHSILDVAKHAATWPSLADRARAAATDVYELLTWEGVTPIELRESLAILRNRMSVDVPSGALELEEEQWDATRVARSDTLGIEKGRTPLFCAVRHRPSGALVAYTVLELPSAHPTASWQGDTLVHGEHRGHRLGMLVKTANLEQLVRRRPQVERVHTWNANENQWMLAINVALGFAPASAEGAWQLRLTAGD